MEAALTFGTLTSSTTQQIWELLAISACGSDVNFPHDILYHDPNFPNCLLYDVIENRPSTEPVTTPTIPPTGTNSDTGIAVAVIACFLVVVLILAAVLVYA